MTRRADGTHSMRAHAGATPPAWAVIAGSGLAALADAFKVIAECGYREIPGLAPTSVEGHPGRLLLARAGSVPAWLCLGRPHFYEHRDMAPIATFVRTLADAGVQTLVVTNAAGALADGFGPGDVMSIRDHLFLPGMAGHHPLAGRNSDDGPRFLEMRQAYDLDLRRALERELSARHVTVQAGVYAMVAGPSYETPAEIGLLRTAGADAVGMSTAPEVVVARHAGMRVAGLSVITNLAAAPAGDADTHASVVDVSKRIAPDLGAAIAAVISDASA